MTSLGPILPLVLLAACIPDLADTTDGPPPGTSSSTTTTATSSSSTSDTPTTADPGTTTDLPTSTDPTGDPAIAGVELLTRLGGLWSGPATMTVLGDFPRMNMDMRAASPHVLFARVDLDPFNSLRFAFSIETHQGQDVLIFRNGGQFIGLDRDTRTALVEHDLAAGHWRFCAIAQGCDYVDAVLDLAAPDHLLLDVTVKGRPHLRWDATREEPRTLPDPFPADLSSQGTGDAPFPPMPSLRTRVTWTEPLAADADVWILLSTTACGIDLGCTHSRSLRTTALAGATSAELVQLQLHPGEYRLNAILDRNQNMPQTLFPDAGDGIGVLDESIVVDLEGESQASTAIFFDL